MNTVITIGYGAAFLLLAAAIWRVDRKSRRRMARANAFERACLPPVTAARETEPGFDLGLQDDCELLWSMPAYTGVDRLLDAIRNDTTEGDQ